MKSNICRTSGSVLFLWALLAWPKMLLEEYFKLSHFKKKLQKLMINMGVLKIFFQELKYQKVFSSLPFKCSL